MIKVTIPGTTSPVTSLLVISASLTQYGHINAEPITIDLYGNTKFTNFDIKDPYHFLLVFKTLFFFF